MKEQAIEKINKMGKAGVIISTIIQVCTIIGIVGCAIGMIVLLLLPKDFVTMKVSGRADVVVDLNAIGVDIDEAMKESIEQEGVKSENLGAYSKVINIGDTKVNGTISLDDQTYEISEISVDGNKINVLAGAEGTVFSVRSIWLIAFAGLLACVACLITIIFVKKLCKEFKTCRTPFTDEIINNMRKVAFSIIPFACLSSLAEGLAGTIVGNTNITIVPNTPSILTILIILALTFVFKYGAMLQKEADETL